VFWVFVSKNVYGVRCSASVYCLHWITYLHVSLDVYSFVDVPLILSGSILCPVRKRRLLLLCVSNLGDKCNKEKAVCMYCQI